MISLLHIENVAVIESADISFDQGFNVLTGETGAGKSIVIDAISAILGQRAYRDVIRTGCNKAFVSAVFTNIPELPWFEEFSASFDPNELLVQREIQMDGKNICRVNGRPVTVSNLKKLGDQLIQIHGQHDSQQLFDEANHLQYLDDFARNQDARDAYLEAYGTVLKTQSEIRKLSMDEGEKARKMESLKRQIEEIEEADPKPGEDIQLEKQGKRLQNAEKLAVGLANAVEALYGGDDSDGACAMVKAGERAVLQLARLDDSMEPLGAKLTELSYSLQDITEELRDLRNELEFSEDELERIETRLDLLRRLNRKYGGDCEKTMEYLQRARDQLDEIEFSADRMLRLEKLLGKHRLAAEKAAMALRETRVTAGETLSKRILSELSQLDMPKVQFCCQFDATDLTERGMDDVRFLMSANIGESLKPMSKVASGGELARIMLALKNVMAEQDVVETLIFDEVDAGISGQAAQKVANKLSSVATNKQILCVTHLAQIAAMADTHLYISKGERNERTFTSVEPLDRNGRKAEIARIIGGAKITETTLKSAEEMLK